MLFQIYEQYKLQFSITMVTFMINNVKFSNTDTPRKEFSKYTFLEP